MVGYSNKVSLGKDSAEMARRQLAESSEGKAFQAARTASAKAVRWGKLGVFKEQKRQCGQTMSGQVGRGVGDI